VVTDKIKKLAQPKTRAALEAAVKTALEQSNDARAVVQETGLSPTSVNLLKKAFGFIKPRWVAALAPASAVVE
jgi:hypothetical protein